MMIIAIMVIILITMTIIQVIAAEGEHKASRSLRLAAEVIADSPAALQVEKYTIPNRKIQKKDQLT